MEVGSIRLLAYKHRWVHLLSMGGERVGVDNSYPEYLDGIMECRPSGVMFLYVTAAWASRRYGCTWKRSCFW